MTDQQMKTISVDDLLRSGNITRRTYNILVRARLRTLFELKKYRTSLRRIFAPQSPNLDEVNQLVDKAQQSAFLPNIAERLFMEPIVQTSKGEQLLESLGEEEMQLLGMVYDNKLRQLLASRQRAHTVIANALNQVPVSSFIRDFLYEDDDRVMILYKVGKTSVEHFAKVKEVMLHAVEQLKEHPELLRYQIFLESTRGMFDDDAFVGEFFKAHQRLPLLYIVQQFVMRNKSRAEMRAFLNRYDIFEGRVELDATPVDRSSYTIATYSNTIFDALFDPAASWEPLDKLAPAVMDSPMAREYAETYPDEEFISEHHPVVAQLVTDEHLLFSTKCVAALLGRLLPQRYIAMGGYSRSLLTAKSERWSHIYLVGQQLDGKYGFRQLFCTFRDEVYAKSEDQVMADLRQFIVKQHPQTEGADDLDLATQIVREIVVGELELPTDEEGRVAVPRMVERSLADRLYLILSANDCQPIALNKLTEIINSGDGRQYVKGTISLALNKDTRFVNNGKKGLYALTEWQLPYFGSNIDIIYKVLSQSDRPMESDEILDVLNQYPYNESLGKNELSSVVSIAKDKFRKFGFGYYGLVDREYAPDLIKPVRNNFEADLQAYRDFVAVNQCLPSPKGGAEEKRLAYWFSRKRKDFDNKTNWAESKREAFKEIISLYEQYQQSPVIPETPESPEPSEIPETPEIPEIPDSPEPLEIPEPSEIQEIPEIPETPESPEIPESPESPESPENIDEEEAIAAIAPEVVAEPPVALFAMDEDSPFIAPDSAEEPPVEIFLEPADVAPAAPAEAPAAPDVAPAAPAEAPAIPDEASGMIEQSPVMSDKVPDHDVWADQLSDLRLFVEQQHREPLALFTAEHQLALWLEEQKGRWHAGELSSSQEQQLLAIRDLLW